MGYPAGYPHRRARVSACGAFWRAVGETRAIRGCTVGRGTFPGRLRLLAGPPNWPVPFGLQTALPSTRRPGLRGVRCARPELGPASLVRRCLPHRRYARAPCSRRRGRCSSVCRQPWPVRSHDRSRPIGHCDAPAAVVLSTPVPGAVCAVWLLVKVSRSTPSPVCPDGRRSSRPSRQRAVLPGRLMAGDPRPVADGRSDVVADAGQPATPAGRRSSARRWQVLLLQEDLPRSMRTGICDHLRVPANPRLLGNRIPNCLPPPLTCG